jgi:hypothetical protein
MTHYGQTDSEKLAEEKQACRQIVSEIANFGISQRQQLFIIYLMSLELEDVETMQVLTSVIRDLGGDKVFISDRAEQSSELDV